MGDLSIVRFAGHDYDGTANGLHQRGIIGAINLIEICPAQNVSTKSLRRLHGHKGCPIGGSDNMRNC